MRLIDADVLEKEIEEVANEVAEKMQGRRNGKMLAYSYLTCCGIVRKKISRQPIAYNLDEVLKHLEEEKEESSSDFERYAEDHGLDEEGDWHYEGLKRALQIVRSGMNRTREEGTILSIPCKVDDELFYFEEDAECDIREAIKEENEFNPEDWLLSMSVGRIVITGRENDVRIDSYPHWGGHRDSVFAKQMGKTVFMSEEDAINKLIEIAKEV